MTDTNPFNNPEFRKEMAALLDEKLTPIATTVAKHEETLTKGKGALAVLAFIWTGFVVLAEWLFHSSPRHP